MWNCSDELQVERRLLLDTRERLCKKFGDAGSMIEDVNLPMYTYLLISRSICINKMVIRYILKEIDIIN